MGTQKGLQADESGLKRSWTLVEAESTRGTPVTSHLREGGIDFFPRSQDERWHHVLVAPPRASLPGVEALGNPLHIQHTDVLNNRRHG